MEEIKFEKRFGVEGKRTPEFWDMLGRGSKYNNDEAVDYTDPEVDAELYVWASPESVRHYFMQIEEESEITETMIGER